MLLLLAIAPAHALDCAAGDSLSAMLAELEGDTSGKVLTVTDGCDVTAIATVRAATLTLQCAAPGCAIGPLLVSGSDLTIKDVRFSTAMIFSPGAKHTSIAASLEEVSGLYVEDSSLSLQRVDFVGNEDSQVGLLAVDSELSITDGSFRDYSGKGILLLPHLKDVELRVEGTEFSNLDVAGIVTGPPSGRGARVSLLSVDRAIFTDQTTSFSDIYGFADVFEHTDTQHLGSRSYQAGVVDVTANSVVITNPVFEDTFTAGSSSSFMLYVADSVSITGGRFLPAERTAYTLIVYGTAAMEVEGGWWEVEGSVLLQTSSLAWSGSRMTLRDGKAGTAALVTNGGTAEWSDNVICGAESLTNSVNGVFQFYSTDVTMRRNVFQAISVPSGPLMVSSYLGELGYLEGPLTLTDNTLVQVDSSSLFVGELPELAFVNNLVSGGAMSLEPQALDSLTAGNNLWYNEETTPTLPDGWPDTDLVGMEPIFVSGYTPICAPEPLEGEEWMPGPWPDPASPVVNAGWPAWRDEDKTVSDIGAYNHFFDEEPPDTGGEDTGKPRNCSEVDDPTTPRDENCDGVAASIGFGGGCWGGSSGLFAPIAAAVGLRRRRARSPRQ